jgi:4-amino-4-deoxy-L-arabinose transferase-like glycosyltransferase
MTKAATNSNTGALSKILRMLEDPRWFRRNVAIVLGIALVVRFTVAAAFWHSWIWQHKEVHDGWNLLAINLVDNGTLGFVPGQPTILRGPIFPLLEAPLYIAFGERYAAWSIILLLLDTVTCFLIMTLFRKLWGNIPALLAGLFYAINLPIIFYTAKIEQVTSILPFVVLYLYLISSWDKTYSCRWRPWALGLVSGLMILNKTVYLPIPIACSGLLIWSKRHELKRVSQLLPVALYLLVTAAVVVPWTARNYVVTGGKLIPVQALFWENEVQDVLYYDLSTEKGINRPQGGLLDYANERYRQMLIANGVSPVCPKAMTCAKWEYAREQVFRAVFLKKLRQDPGKIIRLKVENLWNFWVRAENWQKTRLLLAMQVPILGATIAGLAILLYKRQLHRVKYGLVIILVLWAEHCPVLAFGRYSLDLVPILGLIFGLSISTWVSPYLNSSISDGSC